MTISFCWINSKKPIESGQWQDGLYQAMKLIEKEHTVTYHDQYSTTWEDSDVILFWEAVCCANGEYADFYNAIRRSSKKKILLLLNLIRCESHKYLLEYILKEKIKNTKK